MANLTTGFLHSLDAALERPALGTDELYPVRFTQQFGQRRDADAVADRLDHLTPVAVEHHGVRQRRIGRQRYEVVAGMIATYDEPHTRATMLLHDLEPGRGLPDVAGTLPATQPLGASTGHRRVYEERDQGDGCGVAHR
jgi:hypothetical protein